MQRLQAEGVACAAIDITAIGTWDITPEQWYAGVIYSIVSSLELYDRFDLEAWWVERELLSYVQRFSKFIEEVLLPSVSQNIVIFIDEIDSVLSLNFNIDDFFAVIRECYNKRADNPDYQRLAFALIGVATPSDLIQDKRRTPFNIGRAIELTGFQLQEAQPLAVGLATKTSNSQALLKAVLEWTGGQPFLTQKVCQLALNAESEVEADREAEWVEALVQQHIITHWEAQDEPEHLKTIRDRILSNEQRAGRLLGLYQQILQQDGVSADDSSEQMQLRLTGLVVKREGMLRVYNQIYARVFDLSWVEKALGELRPYGLLFNAWVASECQNESLLLRGQALQDARAWAADKSLSDRDYQFLAASQELDKREILAAERQAKQILAEAQGKAERALEEEKQANQRLAEAQRKAKRQIRIGAAVLALSLVGAAGAMIVAGRETIKADKAIQERNVARSEEKKVTRELASANSALEVARRGIESATQQEKAARQELKNAQRGKQQAEVARQKAAQKAQQADRRLTAARTNLETVSREAQQKTEELGKATQQVRVATQRVNAVEAEAEEAERQALEAWEQFKRAQANVEQAQVELNQANEALEKTREGTKLELAGINSLRQFESVELEALLSAVKVGQTLKGLFGSEAAPHEYPAATPLLALQKIVNNISEQNQINAHQFPIQSVLFSPDGQHLATVSDDWTVRLWNPDGQLLATLKRHLGGVRSASFSADSQRIATIGGDNTIRLWNLSGQQLSEIQIHSERVQSASFSPDGKHLATVESEGTVRIWNLSGQQLAKLEGYSGEVWSVSFSPDGKQIATAGSIQTAEDDDTSSEKVGIVRLWNLAGKPLAKFEAHSDNINSMSFSSDGQRLATASDDGTAKLWDLSEEQGKQLGVIVEGQQGAIRSVGFSPDGQYVATGRNDGTVNLWTISELASNRSLSKGLSVEFVAEPKTKTINEYKGHRGSVNSISFSPKGQHLATAGKDGTVRFWTIPKKKQFQWEENRIGEQWVSFSPDGQILATAGVGGVQLWHLSGEEEELAELPHQAIIWSVSFSPDGERLATVGGDGFIRIWNLSGQQLAQWKGHENTITWVEFSPDGQYLATASKDGTARLWNSSGQQLIELTAHQGEVWSASFHPDGQRLVTVGEDSIVRLWNLSGKLLEQFNSEQGFLFWASFSPDGQHLATAGKDIRLWDLSGQPKTTLDPGSVFGLSFNLQSTSGRQVHSLSFSPDGQLIATAGRGNTIRVWDLIGRQIAEFRISEERSAVNGVRFSPDGQRLAAVGSQGAIRMWRLEGFEELLTRGCNWLKDYLVIHPEALEELSECQDESLFEKAAPALVREGEELAREDNVEGAIAKFQKALAWDSSLDFHPEARAQQLAQAGRLVKEGEELIRDAITLDEAAYQAAIESAIAKFREALEVDPSLNIDPETEAAWYRSQSRGSR
jgi:WD40 repeat protein